MGTVARHRPPGSTAVRVVLVVLALLLPAACGGGTPPHQRLRIATGDPAGVYVRYGSGLAAAVERKVPWLSHPEVLRTDGSVENLRMLADGRADVAFAASDVAADAVNGEGVFTEPLKIAALARLYDDYVQLVVRADGDVHTLGDLAGRRVSIGAPGSGTAVLARRVLDVAALPTRAEEESGTGAGAEVRTRSLGLERSLAALTAGRIDAFFWSGGLPTPRIGVLRDTVRLVDLGEVANLLASRFGDFYTSTRISASVYGVRNAVRTIAVPNYLVAATGTDEDLVNAVTRVLFTAQDQLAEDPQLSVALRLDVRSALSTYPLELHRGAVTWYRQAHG
jgi:TRAP transporter TAXI family solute receptor